ncbi:F-box/WD repeat-containing protein 12 isoform X3 [Synchiropus splendidus]|uniref:F-box/WD repeat-containing protein 12 isoform X3 n=1 Tax=Synchiropus splendidus TaxID=270530 RepID=UPI00237E3E26|nr:F-box/WD repeat-containing protein 12 isoform X3 [Synchiropus splendidus]
MQETTISLSHSDGYQMPSWCDFTPKVTLAATSFHFVHEGKGKKEVHATIADEELALRSVTAAQVNPHERPEPSLCSGWITSQTSCGVYVGPCRRALLSLRRCHSCSAACRFWLYTELIHVGRVHRSRGSAKQESRQDWNDAAETPWIWRRMCLQRWSFCYLAVSGDKQTAPSWKKYYLQRKRLETNMSEGRSGNYTCKSLRGHTGRVVGLVYINRNSPLCPDLWNPRVTVCSASSDGTIRAWDIQNGEQLWSSPEQNPLTTIISDEDNQVIVTADSSGLIKTWQAETGQEVSSYSTASSYCSVQQYNIDNNWFLSVGTAMGSVWTLAGPALTKTSQVMVCDSFKVNMLLVSPDKKWVVAGTKDSDDLSAKVIYSESVTSPTEDEDPLCASVPVIGCHAAVFIPTQPARLAIVHCTLASTNKSISVLDFNIKKSRYKKEILVQQVESFPLSISGSSSGIHLAAKDSNSIVLASGQQLLVYSLKGVLLSSFKDHILPITSICVDSFRVVTASEDLSLRVLTWRRNQDGGLTLEGKYHLLGGSHNMSRGFRHVSCDYSSIVASVEGKNGKDVLKAYAFTS